MCTKNHNHMRYGSWDMEWDGQTFLSFRAIFCPLTPLTTRKIKIFKKWRKKNTWGYHHFTHVHHKWQPYDAWFLRYRAWQTKCFVILDHFFPFTPLTTQKIKNLGKMKKMPRDIYYFADVYHKWQSHDKWLLRYGVQLTEFFVTFEAFFALLPP